MRPRIAPIEQRQPLLRWSAGDGTAVDDQQTSGDSAADCHCHSAPSAASGPCTQPGTHSRGVGASGFRLSASAGLELSTILFSICCLLLWWSWSWLFPAALVEPSPFCLQSPEWAFHTAATRASQSAQPPEPSFDSAVLSAARLAYGCTGNLTALLSARQPSPCTNIGSRRESGEAPLQSTVAELTHLFASATMNDSYRVMNVALETYEGGYMLAARLWDGWLWEDASKGRVRIAKYWHMEEHRAEIKPQLPPAPLPPHNASSLLAVVRVDFNFQPLSPVVLLADDPEVQDPRLYWLHDTSSGNGSSSRLFVLGNTGYPRLGSSVLTIKPRRVMMRGQLAAPASAKSVAVPWVAMLSEVAWSDQKNWTPLALHYQRHVFLVSFFPLQVVDCHDEGGCSPMQCDRSTAALRELYEVSDWRGGPSIVRIPAHYLSSGNSSTSTSGLGVDPAADFSASSSSSLYLTLIHQRAPAPFTYHYSHRLVVLSIGRRVSVRYVSASFQLPPAAAAEPVDGLLRYVEYCTGLVLEQRAESPFGGQLVLTFGRRDSSVHYLTLELASLLPFLVAVEA